MKEVEILVRIESISPLMFNPRQPEEEGPKKAKSEVDYKAEAYKRCYGNEKDGFYIPEFMLGAAFREAGKSYPLKKSSYKKLAAIYIRVEPNQIPLMTKGAVVDCRFGTLPNGPGVAIYRMRFDKWAAEFKLIVDIDRLGLAMAEKIVNEAGDSCGIGSYKPANKSPGPFGRFKVTKFEVLNPPVKKARK